MSELYACKRGTVSITEACQGERGRIRVDGLDDPLAAIITSFAQGQRVNAQFQPALRDAVYVYVFGDMMGKINVKGVLFLSDCAEESGLASLVDFYRDFRASQRAELITIELGGKPTSGFLVQMDLREQDPESLIYAFELSFVTMPDRSGQ